MSIWVFNISKYNTIICTNGHYSILWLFNATLKKSRHLK